MSASDLTSLLARVEAAEGPDTDKLLGGLNVPGRTLKPKPETPAMTSERGLVERLRAVLQSRPITLRVPQVYHDPVHDNPWGLFADDIAEAADLITTLQAENRVVVEALRPLAEASHVVLKWNGASHDTVSPPDDERASIFNITWGDIRRASQILAGMGESAVSQSQPCADAGTHIPRSPEGDWVLVPREPTEEMCAALENGDIPSLADLDGTCKAIWAGSYRDMLAAAPASPAEQSARPRETDWKARAERAEAALKGVDREVIARLVIGAASRGAGSSSLANWTSALNLADQIILSLRPEPVGE